MQVEREDEPSERKRKCTCEQGEEEELQLGLHQVNKDIPPAVKDPLLGLIDLQARKDASCALHDQAAAAAEGLRA